MDASSKMSSASLRVVALATGEDINNLTFVGLVGLMDPPRRYLFNILHYFPFPFPFLLFFISIIFRYFIAGIY
jgi:hypothetical protein